MSGSTPDVPPTAPRGPGRGDDKGVKERRALGWSALAAVSVIVWIVLPVGVGIFLGTLMGFAMQPLYERFKARLRPAPAALVTVLIVTVGIAAMVGGLAYLFVTKGVMLTRDLLAALGPGGSANGLVDRLGARAASFGFSSQNPRGEGA